MLVLSFFHQERPCDCLARLLYFTGYSKGEIRYRYIVCDSIIIAYDSIIMV